MDKSEMTHKNPELRAGSVVKAKESSPKPKSTPTYGKTVAADKPSRFELDGGLIVHTKLYMPLEKPSGVLHTIHCNILLEVISYVFLPNYIHQAKNG